jgi:hypothetical protein
MCHMLAFRCCRNARAAMGRIPAADESEEAHRDDARRHEPGNALLAMWQDDQSGEQGADGGADIAADLEQRLGKAVAAAGSKPRDAR